MSLSYHPLRLADVSVCAIVVHQLLAHLVPLIPLQHDSKLVGRPIALERVPGLRILHQPIDVSLKVLLLGQIDLVYLGELHLLCAKDNYICMSK
jgi:hypothetical protein